MSIDALKGKRTMISISVLTENGREPADEITAVDGDPAARMLHEEEYQAMMAGMSQLPEMSQRCLRQYYFEGMKVGDMVEEECAHRPDGSQVPIGTIKRRLHVARKRLRKIMENYGK
jgi:RNA polymerase sigma-70 factor (ECF subfamily)